MRELPRAKMGCIVVNSMLLYLYAIQFSMFLCREARKNGTFLLKSRF